MTSLQFSDFILFLLCPIFCEVYPVNFFLLLILYWSVLEFLFGSFKYLLFICWNSSSIHSLGDISLWIFELIYNYYLKSLPATYNIQVILGFISVDYFFFWLWHIIFVSLPSLKYFLVCCTFWIRPYRNLFSFPWIMFLF